MYSIELQTAIGGEAKGFSAIVGNPPFQGGKKISTFLGMDYRQYIGKHIANTVKGSADLCGFFFLKASNLVHDNGNIGLVATNTISQGDTREVSLGQMLTNGLSIYRAVPTRPWVGSANLEVAYVWLHKGEWSSDYILNSKVVSGITSFLTTQSQFQGEPYSLVANRGKSFIGSYVLGTGFILDLKEAQGLIDKDPKSKDVLFPYLNGQDLNSHPNQSSSRWIINFFDWSLDAEHDDPDKPKGPPYVKDYPDCLKILTERVKPQRDEIVARGKQIHEYDYWKFWDKRPELYETISKYDRVLVTPEVSKTVNMTFQSPDHVFSHMLVVFPLNQYAHFTCLQSSLHTVWVWQHCSTMREAGFRYSPTDAFKPFPFPTPDLSDLSTQFPTLDTIGETYYTHRQAIMRERQEGLTKTYNRFHNASETASDIQKLRELHIEMDQAVAAAYGWQDLDLGHGFHQTKQGIRFTISEVARREVLDRLLELNHQRYAEEVAQGLHDKGKKKGKTNNRKTKAKPEEGQMSLL